MSTALSGFVFLGVVFLVPETLFDRASSSDSASVSSENKTPSTKEVEVTEGPVAESFTFVQSLQTNLGRHPHAHGSLVHYFIQPWTTLLLPGTWVVMLHYAGLVGGVVTISLIGPQIVSMPPYLWGANAGLINVGGLIGCVVGYCYTYVLADRQLKSKAKQQRRGMAEAEDRLPTMFFPLVVATGGFLVFGFCAKNPAKDRWVGLEAGYAMLTFGLTQVPSVGFNYVSGISSGGCLWLVANWRVRSSSMPTDTGLGTASRWSRSFALSSPLPGLSSWRRGCKTGGRLRRLASSACSWGCLVCSRFRCGCLASGCALRPARRLSVRGRTPIEVWGLIGLSSASSRHINTTSLSTRCLPVAVLAALCFPSAATSALDSE